MKCEKCGAELIGGETKCPKCGADCGNAQEPGSKASGQSVDSDFDAKYSQMFEESTYSGDSSYKVDEELKKKREARYDESFSNMTDDEKIKALEAARLARKERREKKLKKKQEGGILKQLRRTEAGGAEEDTAKQKTAAPEEKPVREDRAPLRSERKASGRPRKGAALSKVSPKIALIAGVVIAAAVIVIVIASVNMASRVSYELPETPTVYTKGDTLYSSYDGKVNEIGGSFIARQYQEPAEPSSSPSRGDDDEESSDETPYFEPVSERDLITYTEDGSGVYFINNANLNENDGSLNYAESGKKNSSVKIADDVYHDIKVSSDGTGVLFLTGTDRYGAGGTLNYWSSVSGQSAVLAENVLPDDYMFGQGGSILYLNEYNSEYYVGNLYLVTVSEGVVSETKMVDSDVYTMFGTNPGGRAVVYAKNYNDETMCFETYLLKADSEERVMVTDGSRCAPVIQTASDGMFAGGSYENYYQTLYYVSLSSGQRERISGNLTEIVKMSSDEQSVVFRKANAEGTAFEYYYANLSGTEGQLIASNITVLDDENHKRVSQFEINSDFTRVAFIDGYDTSVESGGLYVLSIENGVVGQSKKISDTAYSCNITPDGQTVRFADNYNITWNLVTLNAYTNEKNTVLAEEVGAGAFTFDKSGNYIVYAKNYSLESRTGDVYCVSNDGKVREVAAGVSSYGLKNNGEIVYYNSQGGSTFELFKTGADGKRAKSIDEEVTGVVAY